MELIDKSKIKFVIIEPYEYASEPMVVVFKEDIEELPEVQAIPLDKVKKAREKIENIATKKRKWLDIDTEVMPYYENLCDTNPFNDERFGG